MSTLPTNPTSDLQPDSGLPPADGSSKNHQASKQDSTSAHPPQDKPDPTTHSTASHQDAAQGPVATASSTGSTELAGLKVTLRSSLRQYPNFPSPGVLFEDIMPIFASSNLHSSLIRALELQVAEKFETDVDVVVGLESRGFLFGPTLAMRLGAGFVPVRKKGKLPGQCETERYEKEYGADEFQMQADAFKPGSKVLIVDDIIATGGSAMAAGNLVRKIGGNLLGYVFIMELDFLKGREKLDAPVHTLLSGQEEALKKDA